MTEIPHILDKKIADLWAKRDKLHNDHIDISFKVFAAKYTLEKLEDEQREVYNQIIALEDRRQGDDKAKERILVRRTHTSSDSINSDTDRD